ncbi:MAG: 1-acyl-sn-glycerol-3-phosphate acyltransferase [Saprospiraceae bacterium]
MLTFIARIMLWLAGWKVDKKIPKESIRSVMIAAPHTSNWDGIWVRVAFAILEVPVKIAVKDTMTKFPFGLITKPLGFLGINRSKKDPNKPRKSQIEQMADFFKEFDEIAMVIAPEGTRSLRKEWKLGFYYVAKMANVPITFGYLDFEKKVAGVGGVLYPTDNLEADMKKIMEFYKNITPKFPEKYSLDQRYI